MDWADYLRDEAAKYRQLAESAEELSPKQSFSTWQRFVRRQPITSRIVCRAANELVTRTEKGEDGAPVLMPRVTIVDADKISDEAAAAVAEVSQTVNGALRVKLHDKHAALVSIGKHLGMFVDRVQIQEGKQISAEPMSAEEWKRQYVREG
jgi:hypothetical protein